ncbi:hypothetical protein ACQ859_22170 [Roseateles chitinivorans]|uniref:hypothetical protein n=1 Tax=Roseateles chitinivorans TaxID=2917965 RepID=UPI003D67F670
MGRQVDDGAARPEGQGRGWQRRVRLTALLLAGSCTAWVACASASPEAAEQVIVEPAPAPGVRPLTADEESVVLRMARGPSVFATVWAEGAALLPQASETLQRSALLARCTTLRPPAFSLLNAVHRQAVERVAAGQQAERARILGPVASLSRHRAWLISFAILPTQERAALLHDVDGPHGAQVLQAFSDQRVFFDLFGMVDAPSGEPQPAAPVWLKAYFQASGRAPVLRRAIQEGLPEILPAFDRIEGFDRLTPADASWLKPVAATLSEGGRPILDALLAAYPPEVRAAIERLTALEQEARDFDSAMTLSAFPLPRDPARQAMDRIYPTPGEPMELQFGNGMLLPARAELPKLCPPSP